MMAGVLATPLVLYNGPVYASVLCLCTVLFIVCVELLHKYWAIQVPFWSRQLHTTRRQHETFSWASLGFLLTLFLLLWLTPVPVALAASAMLAFGDGFSALIGRAIGRHKIWYNPSKSWEGSTAGFLAGFVGAVILIRWYAFEQGLTYDWPQIVAVCLLGAWFAMVAESLPGLEDNVTVPVFAAIPMTSAWLAMGLEPAWGLLPQRLF